MYDIQCGGVGGPGDRSARRRTEARHIRDVVKLAKQVLYYFEQNHASSHQFIAGIMLKSEFIPLDTEK